MWLLWARPRVHSEMHPVSPCPWGERSQTGNKQIAMCQGEGDWEWAYRGRCLTGSSGKAKGADTSHRVKVVLG